jgi:diguanylate cyclase (GGDEF)-like protein
VTRLAEGLAKLSPRTAVSLAVGATLGLGLLDRLTGSEMALSILHLLPVALAAWRGGLGAGIAVAVLATGLAAAGDGRDYTKAWMPYGNAAVRITVFALLCAGIDAVRRALQSARSDHLTGLPNVRAFRDATGDEIERARRYQRPFTVVYLDVDGFKEVNDREGHTSGDCLLRLVAETLAGAVRRTDMAARLGGDEFAVLMPEADPDAGRKAAHKVRDALSAVIAGTRWHVTFSVGVVTFTRPPRAIEQALHLADMVMYSVKHSGRNHMRHVVFGGEAA